MSVITAPPTAQTPHVQATSTGTGDVKTITVPEQARGMMITVSTNACRICFGGADPDATHGLVLPVAAVPVPFPFASGVTVKVASTIAGNSVVDILFLS